MRPMESDTIFNASILSCILRCKYTHSYNTNITCFALDLIINSRCRLQNNYWQLFRRTANLHQICISEESL